MFSNNRSQSWVIFGTSVDGYFAGCLGDEDVFFDGGNLRVVEELFAAVDVLSRGRQDFDEERRVAEVVLLHADALAGDHHVGVVENVLSVDLQADFKVGHVGLAGTAAEVGVEG
jgi:hypothetical protein